MMLSTPETRFSWAKRDRVSERSLFRTMLRRWRRKRNSSAKEPKAAKWKPAPWTPWLWMK